MKVRKATKGREYTISEEDGEQIKCPICKAVWSQKELLSYVGSVFKEKQKAEVH